MTDEPHPPTPPHPDALTAIVAAAEGLLVPSESDAPFTPFRWPEPGPLTPAALLAHLGLPPTTPIATRTLGTTLDPLTAEHPWFNESQRVAARRFAALRDLIATTLTNIVVYRLGRIRITLIIAGGDSAGSWIGLQTTLIET
jgi:hypothetical protein